MLRLSVRDGDSPFTSAWRAKFNISEGNQEGHFDILTDPETNEGILNVIKVKPHGRVAEGLASVTTLCPSAQAPSEGQGRAGLLQWASHQTNINIKSYFG